MAYCSFPGCEKFAFLFGKCYTHNKPEKKPKPIPRVSKKKSEEDKEYKLLRIEQIKEHPNCQIKIMGVCIGPATTVHHSEKRGKNYLKKESFMSACMPCHDFIETRMSAVERREKGFLK